MRGPSRQSRDRESPETLSQGCSANKRGVRTHPKRLAILKHLRTHIKAKHDKVVGAPFPYTPALTPSGSPLMPDPVPAESDCETC